MKRLFLLFLFFSSITSAFSQDFEEESLLYSDTTISKLKHIVDSLNLKYDTYKPNKKYFSNFQAIAHQVSVKKKNLKRVKKDMDAGISYDRFIEKYSINKKDRKENEVIIKIKDYFFDGDTTIVFSSLPVGNDYSPQFSPSLGYGYGEEVYLSENFEGYKNEKLEEGKWIYNPSDEKFMLAFYIVKPFKKKALIDKYAKIIQYADFMIDTTEQIFKEKIPNNDVSYSEEEVSDVDIFLDYIAKQTNKPQYDDYENYENYYLEKETWDSSSVEKIRLLREKDVNFFDILLKKAAKAALARNYSNDELEFCIGEYYSKETALELKRRRRVMGQCGMDLSPYYHDLNIAKLSAETLNWDIFLRSHLEIIARNLSMQELEMLNINVLDLLLGITLKMENPSQNHYYGSLNKMGKVLTETNNLDAAETKMLDMIADNELDNYNRILIYYLFRHYNYNLEDKERKSENEENLKVAITKLQNYISNKIKEDK